ncbi:hypothetical protein MNBD_GAMMA26-2425 [hydrothermal vent metagenome]|uniref:HTH cro/C1-type domain-containing protein n=1 Tax=hydrothermal vent metagenome TaxID=652676 RepID=A0A3B1AXB9_9ZZZZ
MTTAQANKVEITPEEGVGQYLRVAREERGLSCHEVADALLLSASMIEALEQNDRDKLPGPVFVQGYLRKYARLLGIPEEPVLQAYGGCQVPQTDDQTVLAGSPLKPEIHSNHAVVRMITWAIVFGLLALVVVWWRGYLQWPTKQLVNESDPVSQAVEVVSLLTSGESEFAAEPGPEIETEPDSIVATEPQLIAAIQAEMSIIQEAEVVSDEMPVAEDASAWANALAIEEVSEVTIEIPVAGVDLVDAVSPTEAIDVTNGVVIEFSEACWTEIVDATGTYRLVGNMQAGEQHVLGGTAPYSIVLGNGHGASLTIKGQPFDLAPYTYGNVVRFTLEPEAIPST